MRKDFIRNLIPYFYWWLQLCSHLYMHNLPFCVSLTWFERIKVIRWRTDRARPCRCYETVHWRKDESLVWLSRNSTADPCCCCHPAPWIHMKILARSRTHTLSFSGVNFILVFFKLPLTGLTLSLSVDKCFQLGFCSFGRRTSLFVLQLVISPADQTAARCIHKLSCSLGVKNKNLRRDTYLLVNSLLGHWIKASATLWVYSHT